MANSAEKKRRADNEQQLMVLLYGTAGIQLYYFLIQIVWGGWSNWGWLSFLGTLLLWIAYGYILPTLRSWVGDPTTVVNLKLDKGLVEYMQDVVFVAWALQVLTPWHPLFWLIGLCVPVYALYLYASMETPGLPGAMQEGHDANDGYAAGPRDNKYTRAAARRRKKAKSAEANSKPRSVMVAGQRRRVGR